MKYNDYPKGTFFDGPIYTWCFTSTEYEVYRLDRGLTTGYLSSGREIPSDISVLGYVPKGFFQ